MTGLLDQLRARGVEVVTDGRRLGVVPAGSLIPEEREAIQQFKSELLRLLTPAPSRPPALVVKTVVEVLGPRPTSGQLKALGVAGAEALGRLREEVQTGRLQGHPLLVRGRPLADWLPLDELARLLATWRPRPGGRRGTR